jgi:hypothetical protein
VKNAGKCLSLRRGREGLQSDGGRGQEEKTGWGVTEGEGGWPEVVSIGDGTE